MQVMIRAPEHCAAAVRLHGVAISTFYYIKVHQGMVEEEADGMGQMATWVNMCACFPVLTYLYGSFNECRGDNDFGFWGY